MSTDYKYDFNAIKASVTWEQVVNYLQLPPLVRKAPNKLRGKCSFCSSKGDFSITENAGKDGRGLFNCFHCKTAGDMLELVSRIRGNGLKDAKGIQAAARELHEHFRTGTNSTAISRTVDTSTIASDRPKGHFDYDKYLRGLDSNNEALQVLGLDPDTFIAFKAGYTTGGGNKFRLAVRVDDFQGNCLGFVGQALTEKQQPRLVFPNGFRPEKAIFNAQRLEPGEVRVLPDMLSVMQAYEGGETNTVCFLTDTTSSEQVELFVAMLDAKQCTWTP